MHLHPQAARSLDRFLVGLLNHVAVVLVGLGLTWLTTVGPLRLTVSWKVVLAGTIIVVGAVWSWPAFWLTKAVGREFRGQRAFGFLGALSAITAIGAMVFARGPADEAALRERGVRIHATVIDRTERKGSARCTLQHPDGRTLGQVLSESDGCAGSTTDGDRIWVLHAPDGATPPVGVGSERGDSTSVPVGLTAAFLPAGAAASLVAARAYRATDGPARPARSTAGS